MILLEPKKKKKKHKNKNKKKRKSAQRAHEISVRNYRPLERVYHAPRSRYLCIKIWRGLLRGRCNIPILRGRFRPLTARARVSRFPRNAVSPVRLHEVYVAINRRALFNLFPLKRYAACEKGDAEVRDIESGPRAFVTRVRDELPLGAFLARTLFARFTSHLHGTYFFLSFSSLASGKKPIFLSRHGLSAMRSSPADGKE